MGDYDYANARLRAIKSRLFDARAYQELASLSRVDDLIARLTRSAYAPEIEAALARYLGPRVVMEASRMHLARTCREMRAFFAEDGARLVDILLARWDLFNLRTILRGQAVAARPEAILEALAPVGKLDERALRMLVRQADPLATVDLLRGWHPDYAQAARAALAELASARDWSAVERVLDTIFYERLLASLDPSVPNDMLVRELLAREIDTANLLAALRLRQSGAGHAGPWPFLRGGTLSHEWLAALVDAAQESAALAAMRESAFGAALAGVEKLDISMLQRALERDLARFGVAFFTRDPLTIATAIGCITAKRVEAANLRLIAQGIALGVGRAEIERDLLVV